jgi:anti-sigma factor RsiW
VTHPRSDLTALLDGALGAEERERVGAHLAACAECRAERDRLAATLAALARTPPPPAPGPGFERRFYARLAAQGRPRPPLAERWGFGWRGAWRWFAPGLAGAAATALVLVYAGGRHRDDVFIAEHVDLLEDLEVVASVGVVDRPDDLPVVAHLAELREGKP